MNATAALCVVGVDVANTVFQLAVADSAWRVTEEHRLTPTQFERWFTNRAVGLVVMEACGSAHHWARRLNALGIEVRMLPALYVRAHRYWSESGRCAGRLKQTDLVFADRLRRVRLAVLCKIGQVLAV